MFVAGSAELVFPPTIRRRCPRSRMGSANSTFRFLNHSPMSYGVRLAVGLAEAAVPVHTVERGLGHRLERLTDLQ